MNKSLSFKNDKKAKMKNQRNTYRKLAVHCLISSGARSVSMNHFVEVQSCKYFDESLMFCYYQNPIEWIYTRATLVQHVFPISTVYLLNMNKETQLLRIKVKMEKTQYIPVIKPQNGRHMAMSKSIETKRCLE